MFKIYPNFRLHVNCFRYPEKYCFSGTNPIDQYLAFGISGSNTRTDMIGADVIVVWVSNGQPNAVDYLLTARQQVSTRWNHSVNVTYYVTNIVYRRREKIHLAKRRGFNTIKVFVEILSRCLGQKCFLSSIIKERHLYSWENFHSTLENC